MELFSVPRLGLVVPPENPIAEPEFHQLISPAANVYTARFPVTDVIAVKETFELYNEVLPKTLTDFGQMHLDAAVVACNASHYLLHPDGDRAFCEELSERLGFPVLSSTQAILALCAELGITRLSLVSPYVTWLTDLSHDFWNRAGLTVDQIILAPAGDDPADDADHFNPYLVTTKTLLQRVRAARSAPDSAVLFTGTGMGTLTALTQLAQEDPRRTFLTSNLASAWWARRTLGISGTATHPVLAGWERKSAPAQPNSELSVTVRPTPEDETTAEPLVAVISGGASGIGAAAAAALTARGARVAVLDLDPDRADAAVTAIACDVSDDASVRAAIAEVVERFGRIDIVVNNAGIAAQGDIATNDDDEWRQVLDVNVIGMARLARAALPYLRKSPAAAIVNTSSIYAWVGLPERTVYAASKGAVYALTLAMAADHVREGIRVNAVAPGAVDTPWIERLLAKTADPAAERAALNARNPTGRLVRPEEVGEAIAYLATSASSAITGTILAVDGGIHGLR